MNRIKSGLLVIRNVFTVLLLSFVFTACGGDLFNSLDEDVEDAGPADTYTVSYEDNGSTGGEVPVDLTEYETGDTVTVLGAGTLVKENYEFLRWNTKDDDSGLACSPVPTLTMGESDVTLWAIWTQLPSYTVSFNSQGGSAVSSQSVFEGGFVSEPSDPARTGYSFAGWFQDSSCNIAWDFSSDTITADRTLYADWNANTYTVTFDSRGGTAASPASITVTYDSAYGELPVISRLFYVFDGWWTDINGTGTQVAGSEVTAISTAAIGSDHTLYAKWGWPEYSIGDTGPGNGIIFYINPNAEADGWKYLEAYRFSYPAKVWGTMNNDISGANRTAVGTGDQNTLDILSGDSMLDKAADFCNDFSSQNPQNVYHVDWYLPSIDELELVYSAVQNAGYWSYDTALPFWSSSEYNQSYAWACNMSNGDTTYQVKSYVWYALPVRKH